MKYLPAEANCLFIDGPVSIAIHLAPEQEILLCFERLQRLVPVAARQLGHPTASAAQQLIEKAQKEKPPCPPKQ